MLITCASCGVEINVPPELLGGIESVDQVEPYICDACENRRDLEADDLDHECPCCCEGNGNQCVYSCLDDTRLVTSEEFNHILKIRLHLETILERDMTPKMVDLIRPYQDYLIHAVQEAQGNAALHKCQCGEWSSLSPWLHCPWCGSPLAAAEQRLALDWRLCQIKQSRLRYPRQRVKPGPFGRNHLAVDWREMESCDVCQKTVVRGIVHRIGQAVVCHDCRNALVASYGEEVGYTEAAQQAGAADRFWPDSEIDAATDEVIRRGEDELQRRGG